MQRKGIELIFAAIQDFFGASQDTLMYLAGVKSFDAIFRRNISLMLVHTGVKAC